MTEFGPVTCAGCGLLCDDVTVEEAAGGVRLQPACPLGARWLSERTPGSRDAPAAMIDGQPADIDAALARAVELLRGARRPLLHGFEHATVEDARAACALADRLGALIAPGSRSDPWPGSPAVALRGASTATLGEIRDRSRLVVIWREDPDMTHPRLLERLRLAPPSADRVLVVIDDRDTATAERASLRLRWPAERDLEALVILHALQRGLAVRAGEVVGLHERLAAVPHATFVYGPGLTAGPGGQRRALALHELVRALCDERHVVTLQLPRAPGTRSAADVLAWQTGYPGDVDLASGHPELVTGTGALAEAEGVDVALSIEGTFGGLPDAVTQISLCSRPPGAEVAVAVRTAAAGVEASGTAHRLDGVPLALMAPRPGHAPTAAELLTRLLDEVRR